MSLVSKRKKYKVYWRITKESFSRVFGYGEKRTQGLVHEQYSESWSTAVGVLPQQQYKAGLMWLGNELVIRRGIDYLKYTIEELARAIHALQPESIVEFGSGDGFILICLAIICPEVRSFKGIDLTKEGIQVSKENLIKPMFEELSYVTGETAETIKTRLRGSNIDFVEGDMLKSALPDGSCDLIFSRVALEQLPKDYLQAMKEARRITRKYAIFVEEFYEAQRNIFQRVHLKNSDYFRAPVSSIQKAGFELIRFERVALSKIKFSLGFAVGKVRN